MGISTALLLFFILLQTIMERIRPQLSQATVSQQDSKTKLEPEKVKGSKKVEKEKKKTKEKEKTKRTQERKWYNVGDVGATLVVALCGHKLGNHKGCPYNPIAHIALPPKMRNLSQNSIVLQ